MSVFLLSEHTVRGLLSCPALSHLVTHNCYSHHPSIAGQRREADHDRAGSIVQSTHNCIIHSFIHLAFCITGQRREADHDQRGTQHPHTTSSHTHTYPSQVSAEKQITIEEAPNILTIHLKRFQFGGKGSKITKVVHYEQALNLQSFMSRPECGPQVCVCVCVPA